MYLIKIRQISEDGSQLRKIKEIEVTYGLFLILPFKKVDLIQRIPEKLPYLCIKLHGVKKEMIAYDPFMGIGTTALSAPIRLGVNYIGTDMDDDYVKVAIEELHYKREKKK